MSGSLILVPLRLSLRATGLAVRGAREMVERAADVVKRLATASPEELAAIELDEISNRKRRTVIVAAQRRLALRR